MTTDRAGLQEAIDDIGRSICHLFNTADQGQQAHSRALDAALAACRAASALAAVPSPTYHPGDYESPRTAPFVQVRVNGELVPGHIVYPWPDGGLVVEPLEVAP